MWLRIASEVLKLSMTFFIKEATPPILLKEIIILQSFTTKIQPPPPEKLTTLDC
jgi:hypothetical protein